ncbi:MAG TPA: GNAT family N-acetyltransferase [Candidatus Limnocylindrales bacterium]|nr:GNAT family N-acetyltransferase [Candidatus Limnocylindrales bacterium]
MAEIRILDVVDEASFDRIPPCADPRFDHRTCDYWEDPDRGSKRSRPDWLRPAGEARPARQPLDDNPFRPTKPAWRENPFAPSEADRLVDNPFAPPAERPSLAWLGEEPSEPAINPFFPRRTTGRQAPSGPRKLGLLSRGLGVFGSYAKVLLLDDEPAAYVQFGPLSAYPRALRVRELYPQLPDSPLPAVITCIAVTRAARRRGLARRLVEAVCADLAARGFAAVEAYPEADARPDETSAASPAFWVACGFRIVVDDPRFPVVRRELG